MPVATFMSERQIPWDDKIKEAIAYDVRNAALAIIAGKHATYYGIGIAVNSLADAIINDATPSSPSPATARLTKSACRCRASWAAKASWKP